MQNDVEYLSNYVLGRWSSFPHQHEAFVMLDGKKRNSSAIVNIVNNNVNVNTGNTVNIVNLVNEVQRQ